MTMTSLIQSQQRRQQPTFLARLFWIVLAAWLAFTPTAFVSQELLPATVVPAGAVIDWWRPNDTFPLPEGFQICDGGMVTDQQSPFFGVRLPDLRNRFVRGVDNLRDIGERGGQESHDHMVDLPAHTHDGSTSQAGSHTHSGNTSAVNNHFHTWATWYPNAKDWISGDGQVVSDWGSDGIGSEGSGLYPPVQGIQDPTTHIFKTSSAGGHLHTISTDATVNHTHTLTTTTTVNPAPIASSREDHLPPFIGLLKIMRIK